MAVLLVLYASTKCVRASPIDGVRREPERESEPFNRTVEARDPVEGEWRSQFSS